MVSRWGTKVTRAIRKRLVWRKVLLVVGWLVRHRMLIMVVVVILLQACRVYRRGQAVRVVVVAVRVTETFTERRLMQRRRRLEWLMRAADG